MSTRWQESYGGFYTHEQASDGFSHRQLMICCVLLSCALAIPQRFWRRVTRQGLGPDDATEPVTPANERGTRPWWRLRGVLLRSAGAAVAVYLVGIQILRTVGAAETHSDAWLWVVRSVLLIAIGAACVRIGGDVPTPSASAREVLACGLAVGGLTLFELGAIDMHLFALLEIGDGEPQWDAVFHGTGVVFAVAGWALMRRDGTKRSEARLRTTTSARPPVLAVTSMRRGSARFRVAE